jgi:hypothetical protein
VAAIQTLLYVLPKLSGVHVPFCEIRCFVCEQTPSSIWPPSPGNKKRPGRGGGGSCQFNRRGSPARNRRPILTSLPSTSSLHRPSPHSSSTSGNSKDVSVCGSGAEQGFSYDLGAGDRIRIGQSSNTFDSQHTLRYGGPYPGDLEVDCVDEPDTSELTYTNKGTSALAVYFLVAAYASDVAGDFVLAWTIDTPSMAPPPCVPDLAVFSL